METGKSNWEANKNQFLLALLYEFCGTALVVYSFSLSAFLDGSNSQDQWVRATAYFAAYIFAVHVSGSHFNPATTLAVYIIEKKYKENLKYFIAVIFA